MMFQKILDLDEFRKVLQNNKVLLVYFATDSCSIAEAFEPKVQTLLQDSFPKITTYSVDMNASPKISGQHNVFIEPTILVFFDGKETIRKSRAIGIEELYEDISRPYQLFFE